MKRIILFIALTVITHSLFAQKNQTGIYNLESAKKQIKTGTILTLSGIGITTIGTVMFVNGSGKKDPPTPGRINGDTHTSMGGVIGLGLMLAGPVLVIIGVPDIIYGSIKKNKALMNLNVNVVTFKSFENSAPIRGIRVYFNF